MPKPSFDRTEEYFRGFYQGYSGDPDPGVSELSGEDRKEFDAGVTAGQTRRNDLFPNGR